MKKLLIVTLILSTGFATQFQHVKIIDYESYQSILESQPNKLKLINFWATWCGPCIKEIPELAKIQSELGSEIEVNLVSIDSEELLNKVNNILAKKGYTGNAFLLNIPDSELPSIHENWNGAVPLTLIYDDTNELIMNIEYVLEYEQIKQLISNRNKTN